jgi:hypothetical protein
LIDKNLNERLKCRTTPQNHAQAIKKLKNFFGEGVSENEFQ